ncbi:MULTISPECIES: response regulator [Flavobacterium]|uniref:Response regulator n=1 Tax=Flavobacterium endoglycinae TaxID=2816357 RepID=A0ABX7QBI5_9FLAO|nr:MULTISPECIES: response regulator [Flavobacterium]QSW88401.1 response regulator [Flavobacterium endoglycinae]
MKSIFLIDDDADDREIFAECLHSLYPSISYYEAENGMEGFKLLQSGRVVPDLIFLDLNMPIVNGKTFLTQIKLDENFKDIPVIIYTTSSNQSDKDFASKHHAAMFITKQFSMSMIKDDLKKAVIKFLDL